MNAIRKHATYFSRKQKTPAGHNVEDFTETKITLKKESTGLGISIIGGCDTYLDKILVTSINLDSTAFRDGRLRIGDELLAVNEVDLRGQSHEFAVQQIRLARSPVELSIFRENIEKIFTDTGDPNELVVVELNKGINERLGLGIYARKDGNGVFVTSILDGSLAATSRQFQQGDQIISVNEKDFKTITQTEATNCLRNLFGPVYIVLGRNRQTAGTLQHFMYNSTRATKVSTAANSKIEEPPFRSPRFKGKKTRPKTMATDQLPGDKVDSGVVKPRCSSSSGQVNTYSVLRQKVVLHDSPKTLRSSMYSSEPDIIDISVNNPN